jgi:hypothetical protein
MMSSPREVVRKKCKYVRVELRTEADYTRAEALKEAGWRIVQTTPFSLLFETYELERWLVDPEEGVSHRLGVQA